MQQCTSATVQRRPTAESWSGILVRCRRVESRSGLRLGEYTIMASPIGYLIHPDPPSVPNLASPGQVHYPTHPAHPVRPGSDSPLGATPTPTPGFSATPSLARPGPGHLSASTSPGNHTQAQSLYQCADCLRA